MGRGIKKKYILTKSFIKSINKYLEKTNLSMWKLAAGVNLHPSTLSHAMHGKFIYETVIPKMNAIAQQISFKGVSCDLIQSQGDIKKSSLLSMEK